VLDAGYGLDPPDGLLAGGPAHAHQCQQGNAECEGEQGKYNLMRQLGQPGPQPGQRDPDEQAGQPQDQPGPRPEMLEEKGPLTEPHLALESALDGRCRRPPARRGSLLCCHYATLARPVAVRPTH
jgi:hypothetical protein